jgi:hypothetical protein
LGVVGGEYDAASSTETVTSAPVEPAPPMRQRQLLAQPLARELAIVLLAYLLYGQVRNLIDGRISTAEAFATWLLSLEQSWGIDIELGLNQWVAAREPVAVGMNYYYALLHFTVTAGVLIWLWHVHRDKYPLARTSLILGSMVALLGFWLLPLAPPRLMPNLGYVDTFWFYNTWGSLSDPALARFSNQYAAMPSLHVGWALWSGVVVFLLARRRWLRTLALLYPAVTLVVVMGTANHFVLDAVGSVIVMGTGAALAWLIYHPPQSPRARTRAAVTVVFVATALMVLLGALRPPYDIEPPRPDRLTASVFAGHSNA